MPEDVVDATAAPSSADVTAGSSPGQDPLEPADGTAAPGVVEEAKIPLSRLNEVIEQRKAAEAREARLLEALQRVQTPVGTAPAAQSFWEGRINHADPATAQYWQQQKQMIDLVKQEAKDAAIQELQPVIDAGRGEIARLNIERFREKNPDITSGSEDERQIVAYMTGQVDGMRHPLESARKNVLFDRMTRENQSLKGKHSAIPRKEAANVEQSSGIPASAGLPGKAGGWRQDISDAYDASGGDLLSTVNALTRKKR
jgi:hypothetical protein